MTSVLALVNGLPTMTSIAVDTPYDQSIYYATGLAANTPITLPNSGSFSSSTAADLLVIRNNQAMEVTRDFTVVGSGPTYTQIEFVYAFPNDTIVRFKQGI